MSRLRRDSYRSALDFAQRQVRALVKQDPGYRPMYTTAGRWRHEGEQWTDWCGGFLAGMMWLFEKRTGDTLWRADAQHYSRLLEPRKTDQHVHDLGFIFLNSYRRWFTACGVPSLMDVVAEAGVTLAGRFQERGQFIASFLGPHSLFVDIMMNVPLLFVAADWLDTRSEPEATHHSLTARRDSEALTTHTPSELRRKAHAHCRTSQSRLVRRDGSTAHEAIFDTVSGSFLRESTQQGFRPESCWSRGLAWSLYGFATVYRLTRDARYLATALECANCFLLRLPPGRVPDWDFDAPEGPGRFFDSSAAAIAASGLLEICDLIESGNPQSTALDPKSTSPQRLTAVQYREAALAILDALCSDEFLASSRPGWEGVLLHGVYHLHKKLGVDESVMWGDHFFVEALTRALEWLEANDRG